MKVTAGEPPNFEVMSSDLRLFFLGSPLADVTANVDSAFLKKYGLEKDSAYVVDDDRRRIFGEIRGGSVTIGGSVTNTARTVRKVRGFTQPITYLGTIGNDENGRIIKEGLDREDLGSDLVQVEGSTGKVAVLLVGTSRTLVTDLGVSRSFTLNDAIWRKLEQPSLVYLSGFFINVSFEIVTQLISKNKTLALNLGAPFLCEEFPDQMLQLYRHSSIIFGNESEHRAFARILNLTSNDLADLVISTNRKLDERSRVVCVTRGGGPVLVVRGSHWCEFEVRFPEAELVDTNGAGDAFAGGFLARFTAGDSVANCVECGVEMAHKIIRSVGFNLE